MKKILNIGWKDLVVIFRDRSALLMMLAAPFVLTLGLGFVTGSFSGSGNSGLSEIPVAVANQDEGTLGVFLIEVLNSPGLTDLLDLAEVAGPAEARQQVDDDQVAAAVIIPEGFSASIIPATGTGETQAAVPIEVYASRSRPISAGVIESIVRSFTNRVETGRISGQVAVAELVDHGLISVQDAPEMGRQIGSRLAAQEGSSDLITIRPVTSAPAGETGGFEVLAYLATGMALLFLMYTVSLGGRSILDERRNGTLARMLSTPTSSSQVLAGKILGVYLTGVAQMGILILASTLLFNLRWGNPLAVAVLVLAVVAGATGWGILLASIARSPAQVSSVGTAMMLVFGILGGNFIADPEAFPGWVTTLGKITPNGWGQEAFSTLSTSGTLADMLVPVSALLTMGAVLFGIAVYLFQRRGLLA